MTQRTWQRSAFPESLKGWNEPPRDGQSFITHSEDWAQKWLDMGCEVREITDDKDQPCTPSN